MSTTPAESSKDEYERLKAENRSCRCGGNGMVIVFHPQWSGDRVSKRPEYNANGDLVDAPFAAEVSAHCSCPVGQWMRDRTDPQLQKRIPWVKDILEGRSRWRLESPGGEPEEQHRAPTRADVTKMFQKPPIKPFRQTPEQIAAALKSRPNGGAA